MNAAALSLDNPVFRVFLGYGTVVIVKTYLVGFLTAYQRMKNKAPINEEDAKAMKVAVTSGHPMVLRCQRIHLNDLENVIPFCLLGLLYVTTGPSLWAATVHFRLFTALRVAHTLVYYLAVPQPTRALCHLGAVGVSMSMAYRVLQQAAF